MEKGKVLEGRIKKNTLLKNKKYNNITGRAEGVVNE